MISIPRSAVWLSLAGSAFGFLGLIGWAFDIAILRTFFVGTVAMNPLTAIVLMLAGVGTIVITRWRRLLNGIVILLGSLKLVDYLGGSLGLDQLLFREEIQKLTFPMPNQMAPNTAMFFVLLGVAQILAVSRSVKLVAVSAAIATIVALLSMFAIFGYVLDTTFLYGLSGHIPMAANTATAFMALSAAVLFSRPDSGLAKLLMRDDRAGNVMARRLLPACIFLPVVVGWLRLEGQRMGLFPVEYGVQLMMTFTMVVLSSLVIWSALHLNRLDELNRRSMEATNDLNRKLARSLNELEVLNKELETFSYSVSHDLRAPLRSIAGFSTVLIEDHVETLNPTARDHLSRITDAARRMGTLIDGLLRLSKLGRQSLSMENIDLSRLASGVASELSSGDPERRAEFEIQPGVVAIGDGALMRAALSNLIGNAWKFTSKREIARIEFGATNEEGETVCFVRDDGVGFDMAFSNKLFGAFQRLHAVTEFEGTGIGLATVQRIVHRHGGRIWAESEVGKGTTFFFTLGDGVRLERTS